jgi:hypothetical protein
MRGGGGLFCVSFSCDFAHYRASFFFSRILLSSGRLNYVLS